MLSVIIYIYGSQAYNTIMNEELIANLEELGLSQKEARVYLANLMIGPASVQKIADQAGIKRVTTYVILEALINLGLVSQSTRGKKTSFTAEDPVSLKRLLDKKEEQVKEQKRNFEEILPQLSTLKGLPQDAPSVKFYEGVEGIKSIVKTAMPFYKEQKYKQVYGISNLDDIYSVFPEFKSEKSNPERVRLGIKSKFLYTSSHGPILKPTDKAMLRESRFVPSEKYPFVGDISIAGDNIVLFSLAGSRPIGVTIRSAELAKAMIAFFDLAWDAAEKFNK